MACSLYLCELPKLRIHAPFIYLSFQNSRNPWFGAWTRFWWQSGPRFCVVGTWRGRLLPGTAPLLRPGACPRWCPPWPCLTTHLDPAPQMSANHRDLLVKLEWGKEKESLFRKHQQQHPNLNQTNSYFCSKFPLQKHLLQQPAPFNSYYRVVTDVVTNMVVVKGANYIGFWSLASNE